MSRTLVREMHASVIESHGDIGDGRVGALFQLISPGIGSGGAYPAETLEAAGRAGVFPADMHIYADHPTRSEERERPERTIRDLAGAISEAAHWDESRQALVAEGWVDQDYGKFVDPNRLGGIIGMSIRAYATIEEGTYEGKKMPVVKEILEGISVDLVTHAGRDGKVLTEAQRAEAAAIVESARASRSIPVAEGALIRAAWAAFVGDYGRELIIPLSLLADLTTEAGRRASAAIAALAEAGISETTVNDRREQLDKAVSAAHAEPDETYAWLRDFDPEAGVVYFDVYDQGESSTFRQSYAVDDDGLEVTLTGDAEEVTVRTEYVPVNPAGSDSTEESSMTPEETAAHATALSEAAGRAQAAEAERDTLRQTLAERDARDAARPIVTAIVTESVTLAPSTVARVTESVIAAVPLTEAGVLDEAAVRAAATAARTVAETEVAEYLRSTGAGQVRTFGGGVIEESADSKSILAALDAQLDQKIGA